MACYGYGYGFTPYAADITPQMQSSFRSSMAQYEAARQKKEEENGKTVTTLATVGACAAIIATILIKRKPLTNKTLNNFMNSTRKSVKANLTAAAKDVKGSKLLSRMTNRPSEYEIIRDSGKSKEILGKCSSNEEKAIITALFAEQGGGKTTKFHEAILDILKCGDPYMLNALKGKPGFSEGRVEKLKTAIEAIRNKEGFNLETYKDVMKTYNIDMSKFIDSEDGKTGLINIITNRLMRGDRMKGGQAALSWFDYPRAGRSGRKMADVMTKEWVEWLNR